MRVQPGKHAIDDPLSAFLKECVLSILISDIDVHLIRQILSSVLCAVSVTFPELNVIGPVTPSKDCSATVSNDSTPSILFEPNDCLAHTSLAY